MMNEIVRTRNALNPYLQGDIGISACDDNNIQITRRNLPHWKKRVLLIGLPFVLPILYLGKNLRYGNQNLING